MDLEKLFHPKSIVIIGVSHEAHKVGYLVAKNMVAQGYEGELYFVNNKDGDEILDHKVYKTIGDIGKPIDLAVLAVPAEVALTLLDDLHAQGINQVVLFAAGFKEIGDKGLDNEKALLEKINAYGMTLLGPNCIGYINTKDKINTTFLKHVCPDGNIGFITQSGALGSVMVDIFSMHKSLGFSYFFSIGNKSQIDESELLEYLSDDPDTHVIAMYLEDVKHGPRFAQILKKTTLKKPVVIIKSGRTKEGSLAARSHTGSMIGDSAVYDSVFEEAGAIIATGFSEFFDLLKVLSFDRAPHDGSILILSNAGGAGVLVADDIVSHGLTLTTISAETMTALYKDMAVGSKISVHNPLDLLGDASAFDYSQAIQKTVQERTVGAVLVLLTPQANTQVEETARTIIATQNQIEKPIYPIFMGEDSTESAKRAFEEEHIASFSTYDTIGAVIAKIRSWRAYQVRLQNATPLTVQSTPIDPDAHDKINAILSSFSGKSFLPSTDSLSVLSYVQIPVVLPQRAANEKEAVTIAQIIGYPVVAKVASAKVNHKTEVGGVVMNITDEASLKNAYEKLQEVQNGADGIYVQKQIKGGYEVMIGAKRDATFGIVVTIGMGGIYTELYHDVALSVYPFTYDEFVEKLTATKLSAVMRGFRGAAPLSPRGLYLIAHAVGSLFEAFPQIMELDINPVIISPEMTAAIDARIIIA